MALSLKTPQSVVGSVTLFGLTINVFVLLPHQQRSQQQQQQADAHAAHNEARVVLLLCQRHLAKMSDGVCLTPLKMVHGINNMIKLSLTRGPTLCTLFTLNSLHLINLKLSNKYYFQYDN